MQILMLKSVGVALPLFEGKQPIMTEKKFGGATQKVQAHEHRFLVGNSAVDVPDALGKELIKKGFARETDPVLDDAVAA